jgi:hypothetical protein
MWVGVEQTWSGSHPAAQVVEKDPAQSADF